jgi:hypothetical protein
MAICLEGAPEMGPLSFFVAGEHKRLDSGGAIFYS